MDGARLRRLLELTGAQYAAIGVLDEHGQQLERFVTAGIDEARHRAIGDLPRGRGALGVLIRRVMRPGRGFPAVRRVVHRGGSAAPTRVAGARVAGAFAHRPPPTGATAMTPCQIMHQPRELDSRINDGIHVRLLWCETDGQVSVHVDDRRTGSAFTVPVRAGQRAIDVFHHPFAYAA